jgi:hypothetical protein
MYEVEYRIGSCLRLMVWYCMLLAICAWLAKQFLIVRQLNLAAVRGQLHHVSVVKVAKAFMPSL